MREEFAYRAFGLNIRSGIELPELLSHNSTADADVTIAVGFVPAMADPGTEFSVNGQGAFLAVPGVARYWISDGSRILIAPEAGAPPQNVRLFLLGSAMGVLLHQRGHLPLHANAVEVGGKAFAFMGESGAGKSTLAAAFHDRGNRVVADDVCVIQFEDDGTALACPGIPRLRLWEEALAATGRNADAYQLSYAGNEGLRKFDVPVDRDVAMVDAVPLKGLFILTAGDEFELSKIDGIEAANTIFANTYRGKYVAATGSALDHWQSSIRLIRSTPLFRFQRRWGFADFDDQLARLRHFLEQLGAES